jgi:hypothetical protein
MTSEDDVKKVLTPERAAKLYSAANWAIVFIAAIPNLPVLQ